MSGPGRAPPGSDRQRSAAALPRLRSLDVIKVVDKKNGLVTLLRDGDGVGENVMVPPPLDGALRFLDGHHSPGEIASLVSRSGQSDLSESDVEGLVEVLEKAHLLDGERYRARLSALREEFDRSPMRRAFHAGGAYHADPSHLRSFIESQCISAAKASLSKNCPPLSALIAPHMDLWRAARGYGHAYGALLEGLGERADTFILLGTCHAGLRAPFALTRKSFDTPFGPLESDPVFAKRLATRSGFDVFEDEYQHKAEHSIEFQAVFLRHILGAERAKATTIVPILCGLGRSQSRRSDPTLDRDAESFLGELEELTATRGDRVMVIAGADLAHMGPRFGDPKPLDADERRALSARDGKTLELASDGDALGFFEHATADLDERRICGVGPIYTLLRLLPSLGGGAANVHDYTQHIDPDEGSIVSHASMSFARV